MKEQDEMTFDIDEDEGLDLNKPKVEIIADEEDTPEQKEKKKANIEKIKKYGLIGLGSVLVLGVILFIIFRPKETERVLPFSIESGTGTYTASGEIKDDAFIVEKYSEYSEYYAIAFNTCNMKDKPTNVGGNTLITLEKGESAHILGDVCDKDGNFLEWFYCFYDGKFGYLSTENVSQYNRKDGLVTLGEEELQEETTETVVEELNDEEQAIKEKAFVKEIENITYNLSKHEKYELERYSMRKTYTDLLLTGGFDWVNHRETDEHGNIVLEKTTNDHVNLLIDLMYKFDTLKSDYVNATDKTEEEKIVKDIESVFTQYTSTYGPFLTQEEYDSLVAEELQKALELEAERNGVILESEQVIENE